MVVGEGAASSLFEGGLNIDKLGEGKGHSSSSGFSVGRRTNCGRTFWFMLK